MRHIKNKKEKRGISKIAAAVLLTSMVMVAAALLIHGPAAEDVQTLGSGDFDDGSFEYTETADGEVTITGRVITPSGDLTIPSSVEYGGRTYSVTSIAAGVSNVGVFSQCTGITSVTIPDSVREIGMYAFYQCTGLVSADLGSVSVLGSYAFARTGLTSVTIPDSMVSAGTNVFSSCKDLRTVTMVGSPVIGARMFVDCKNLTSVDLGSVTVIQGESFTRTGLTSVTIPGSVWSIEASAFTECDMLETVTIPDTVTNIGKMAFGYSGLKAAAVPAGASIGYSAFNMSIIVYYSEVPVVTAVMNADGTVGMIIPAPAGMMIAGAAVTNASLGKTDAVFDSGLWSFDPSGEKEFVLSLTFEHIVVPVPETPDNAGNGPWWWPFAIISAAFLFLILWARSRYTVTVAVVCGDEGLAGVCVRYTIDGAQGSLTTPVSGIGIIPARAGSEVVIISAEKEGYSVSDIVVISGDVCSVPEGALVSVTAEKGTKLNFTVMPAAEQ